MSHNLWPSAMEQTSDGQNLSHFIWWKVFVRKIVNRFIYVHLILKLFSKHRRLFALQWLLFVRVRALGSFCKWIWIELSCSLLMFDTFWSSSPFARFSLCSHLTHTPNKHLAYQMTRKNNMHTNQTRPRLINTRTAIIQTHTHTCERNTRGIHR